MDRDNLHLPRETGAEETHESFCIAAVVSLKALSFKVVAVLFKNVASLNFAVPADRFFAADKDGIGIARAAAKRRPD